MSQLLVLFIITILFALVALENMTPECSSGCGCYRTRKKELNVDCSDWGFTQIPRNIPKEAVHLNLSLNPISSLNNGDLRGLTLLKVLDLRWTELKDISLDTFLDTPRLE
jgi:hypothetical protein